MQKQNENQEKLITFLSQELGDDVRGVLIVDSESPSEFTVHMNEEIDDSYSKEEFRRLGQRLILKSEDLQYYEDSYRIGKLDSEIEQFGDTTLIYLIPDDETRVLISIDPGRDISAPSFPRKCLDILRGEA